METSKRGVRAAASPGQVRAGRKAHAENPSGAAIRTGKVGRRSHVGVRDSPSKNAGFASRYLGRGDDGRRNERLAGDCEQAGWYHGSVLSSLAGRGQFCLREWT